MTTTDYEAVPAVAGDAKTAQSTLVMKFGGTSVADAQRLKRAAARIVAKREGGHRVVAVLSARGKETDRLIADAQEVSDTPDPREMDMLLSTGERVSCALCAMAINDLGHRAISLTGSQAGIVTDTSHTKARILDVRADRIMSGLGLPTKYGRIPVAWVIKAAKDPVAGRGPSGDGPVASGLVAMNRAPRSISLIARVMFSKEWVRVSPSTT